MIAGIVSIKGWPHRATVGALIVLFIWHQVVSRRSV